MPQPDVRHDRATEAAAGDLGVVGSPVALGRTALGELDTALRSVNGLELSDADAAENENGSRPEEKR